jgi:hypothetical protein
MRAHQIARMSTNQWSKLGFISSQRGAFQQWAPGHAAAGRATLAELQSGRLVTSRLKRSADAGGH